MLSTDTNYYCEKSWKDGLFYIQERGNRQDEKDLKGYKTLDKAWGSVSDSITHPRRYQIALSYGGGSFGYLYVIQEDGEDQKALEQKVQKAFREDYEKQINCPLRWTPYTVRPTVKVKELKRGISKTLRGGNHFSLVCA